jgi:hypothetical protein
MSDSNFNLTFFITTTFGVYFSGWIFQPGVLNKETIVLLDGAKPFPIRGRIFGRV